MNKSESSAASQIDPVRAFDHTIPGGFHKQRWIVILCKKTT